MKSAQHNTSSCSYSPFFVWERSGTTIPRTHIKVMEPWAATGRENAGSRKVRGKPLGRPTEARPGRARMFVTLALQSRFYRVYSQHDLLGSLLPSACWVRLSKSQYQACLYFGFCCIHPSLMDHSLHNCCLSHQCPFGPLAVFLPHTFPEGQMRSLLGFWHLLSFTHLAIHHPPVLSFASLETLFNLVHISPFLSLTSKHRTEDLEEVPADLLLERCTGVCLSLWLPMCWLFRWPLSMTVPQGSIPSCLLILPFWILLSLWLWVCWCTSSRSGQVTLSVLFTTQTRNDPPYPTSPFHWGTLFTIAVSSIGYLWKLLLTFIFAGISSLYRTAVFYHKWSQCQF